MVDASRRRLLTFDWLSGHGDVLSQDHADDFAAEFRAFGPDVLAATAQALGVTTADRSPDAIAHDVFLRTRSGDDER